ncbi:hypothetical protein AB1K70_25985 [Bremerella sp. JC770]|uniref:hypothetical protein n=1 Tax=Bremerella sp. JC770 TaxID=3232137 RepID=UPI0034579B56
MSHHHNTQPEKHGAHAPQVAVRDGNRLLCPCCGEVLMVLQGEATKTSSPATTSSSKTKREEPMRHRSPSLDALIRRQEAQEEAARQASDRENAPPTKPPELTPNTDRPNYRADPLVIPIDPKIAAHQFPEGPPPPVVNFWKPKTVRTPSETIRPQRLRGVDDRFYDRMRYKSKKPLPDPCTYEMARLYAWTYYRMQKLDLQLQAEIEAKQAEIDALKRELDGVQEAVALKKSQPVRKASPQEEPRAERPPVKTPSSIQSFREARKAFTRRRKEAAREAFAGHAHEDEGMAPGAGCDGMTKGDDEANNDHEGNTQERGPP